MNLVKQLYTIALVTIFGLFVIWGLGISGLWMSIWGWLVSFLLAFMLLMWSYYFLSKRVFKILRVYVLIAFLAATPVFAVSQITKYQSIAQTLTSSEKINYFRNVLGRSYNYTELIQWENLMLSWNNSSSMIAYTDPIEIYNYGQARCAGYAILYAELCISQGYQCRIVVNIFGDHVWNEVKIDGEWIRVDASPTGAPMNENIGYPLFYEEKWHAPPILALAFEGSSIVDVTSTYRSDHWSLLSASTIIFVLMGVWFAVCIHIIWKKLLSMPRFSSSIIKR
ncbi:transglutaminase domain-containing protein [Candidatus Bathyarchaeota archaeon A05DMB-5]|nr:transglutaminase domain-containing protein [Candidatus Bathyarchaeota archaeon A05DMB-5]